MMILIGKLYGKLPCNLLVRLIIIFLLCALFFTCKKKETPPPAAEETVTVQENAATQEEPPPETSVNAADSTSGNTGANTSARVSYSVQRPKQGLASVGGRVNTREINPVNYENPDIEILKQMGAEPELISFFTGKLLQGGKLRQGPCRIQRLVKP